MTEKFSKLEKVDIGREEKEKIFSLSSYEREIMARLPKEIKEEDVLELKRIASVVAGDLGMKIKLGEPGKGSFFNHLDSEITLDPLHVAENPSQARFIAAHEGSHRRLSRTPSEIGVRQKIQDELFGKAVGFSYLSNAIEDPAINNWAMKEFEKLRGDFENTYEEMFKKEHIPLGLEHPEVAKIARRTGTVPNIVWVGSELIRYWHKKKFSKDIKKIRPNVTKALAKSLMPAVRAYNTLPEHAYSESEVIDKAKERFEIIYKDIWGHMQPLLEEDRRNEEKRRMMEEKLGEKYKKEGKKSLEDDIKAGKTGTPLDELPEDLREELAKKVKEAEEKQAESFSEEEKELEGKASSLEKEEKEIEKEKADLEKKKKEAEPEGKEKIKEEEEKLKTREKINEAKREELKKREEEIKKQKENIEKEMSVPIEMNELSEELGKKLEEMFKNLPEKERERLRKEAEKTLEDLEDALNKQIMPKINPRVPESHKDYRDRKKLERKEEKAKKVREREFEEMKKGMEEIEKEAHTEYDELRSEMDETIEDLYHRLEEFFVAKRHPKWRKGFRTGPRISLLKAMDFASGAKPSAYREMFERKTTPERYEYQFSLLVDLSSSMGEDEGDKIKETRKGLVVISEVLDRLGIDFEILGFNSDIGTVVLKDFEKEFDEEVQDRLVELAEKPGGSTPTSGALENAYNRIKDRLVKDNFIVVLTDGQPFPEGSDPTKKLVRKILKDEENLVKIVGVGLGKETGFVRDLFPSAVGNIKAKNLTESLGDLLEEMITNPELFELGEEKKEEFIGK